MSTRKFPAYTTEQLKEYVAEGATLMRDAAKLEMIREEVARREAGLSVVKVAPQVPWN